MTLLSLHQLLLAGAPDTVIAVDGERDYTRRDWQAAIAALMSSLQANPARRWLLSHDNSWHFSIGLFALLAAGKQVILPPNALPGTLHSMQVHADALLGEGDIALPRLGIATTAASHTNCNLPGLPINSAITLFTSGSTGEPKAIHKPLACLDAEIRTQEALWGRRIGNATVFSSVSHQHLYGLLFRLLWPLCASRPFTTTTLPYPEMLLAGMARHPRTVLVSSPSLLARFVPARENITGTAVVFSSGGPLPLEVAQVWQQALGDAPVEVLGSTETGGVAWRQQTDADIPWRTLPSVSVSCDNDNLLWVQSPFLGASRAIPLGDRGQLAGEGSFTLSGRADRIAKIEGKRLSLEQMEQRLCASGLVTTARVLPLPTGRLAAVVIPNTAGQTLLDDEGKRVLCNRLLEVLALHFERVLLPRKWRFPNRLPQNTLGKTTQADLLALFNEPDGSLLLHKLSSTADSLELGIEFAHDATVFAGHFPELPILPGVIQFDLAVRQCARWYPLTAFRQIDKLKFQEPIVPGDSVTLSLQHLGDGQVQFAFRLAGKPMSSGRIVFATRPL